MPAVQHPAGILLCVNHRKRLVTFTLMVKYSVDGVLPDKWLFISPLSPIGTG